MLVFEERGKLEYPEKNLSEQSGEPTTNPIHVRRRAWKSNPGHISGRRTLSSLRHSCPSELVIMSFLFLHLGKKILNRLEFSFTGPATVQIYWNKTKTVMDGPLFFERGFGQFPKNIPFQQKLLKKKIAQRDSRREKIKQVHFIIQVLCLILKKSSTSYCQ